MVFLVEVARCEVRETGKKVARKKFPRNVVRGHASRFEKVKLLESSS